MAEHGEQKQIRALYVHIPFCVRKCNYCDFFSLNITENKSHVDAYLNLIKKELDDYKTSLDFSCLDSLYIGGGTPTAYPQLIDLVAWLKASLNINESAEITVEANPCTLDKYLLRELRQAGVNRLSLGVQSFDDELLSDMGRLHNSDAAIMAVTEAQKAGFDNISIDLIYGLPNQTMEIWQETLAQAVSLSVPHISVYGLSIHEDTPWGELMHKGALTPAEDSLHLEMMTYAAEFLSANGFEHYEISNFARVGCRSRHNQAYWHRLNYLGLGAAAASCIENKRFKNVEAEYFSEPLLAREVEELSREQVLAEAVFLQLRMSDGIDIKEFNRRYAVNLLQKYDCEIEKLISYGLLENKHGVLKLTKKGIPLSNEVFLHFLP